MKVICSLTGVQDKDLQRRGIEWPADWPAPRRDDVIEIPGIAGLNLVVREIVWYPKGDLQDPFPFLYLVVGPPRMSYVNG